MMIEATQNQICSSFYNLFIKPYLLSSTVVLFTIPILVFSTIFLLTFNNKRKLVLSENPTAASSSSSSSTTVAESDAAAQEADKSGIEQEFQAESHDLPSDDSSESSDDHSSSGNNYLQQNPDDEIFSDDEDDEDGEGLIEIAIPSSNEEPKVYINDFQSNILPINFLPESIFKQQELVDQFLAEMNEVNIEEENLIEIDISMGSIKCPRFEIEA